MAGQQAQLDENNKFNHCSGAPQGQGTCGGSRKKKMKYRKKNNKKNVTVVRSRIHQKKRHDTRYQNNRNYTTKNR
jgi:hypothetical protein